MYRAVTRNIEVVVTPRFVADRSSPDNNYFFWAYTIAITNHSDDTVHWRPGIGASPMRAAGAGSARRRCRRRQIARQSLTLAYCRVADR